MGRWVCESCHKLALRGIKPCGVTILCGDQAMLAEITDELVDSLSGLSFESPVTHFYNPLVYARESWDVYCEKWGQGQRKVLLVGMNPGPPGLSNPYEASTLRRCGRRDDCEWKR